MTMIAAAAIATMIETTTDIAIDAIVIATEIVLKRENVVIAAAIAEDPKSYQRNKTSTVNRVFRLKAKCQNWRKEK